MIYSKIHNLFINMDYIKYIKRESITRTFTILIKKAFVHCYEFILYIIHGLILSINIHIKVSDHITTCRTLSLVSL